MLLGVGSWRSWYAVERTEAPAGKIAYRLEIDFPKVGDDAAAVGRAIKEKLDRKDQARAR